MVRFAPLSAQCNFGDAAETQLSRAHSYLKGFMGGFGQRQTFCRVPKSLSNKHFAKGAQLGNTLDSIALNKIAAFYTKYAVCFAILSTQHSQTTGPRVCEGVIIATVLNATEGPFGWCFTAIDSVSTVCFAYKHFTFCCNGNVH